MARKAAYIIGLILLLVVQVVFAQGSGVIYGTVRDASGAVIAGAEVTITNSATGIIQKVTTQADGAYIYRPAPIGEYRVETQVSGFKKWTQSEIVVRADERVRVDVAMEVGGTQEVVEVVGQPPLVESTQATLSTLVDSERIKQLPLNGRSVLDLQKLITGFGGSTSESGGQVRGVAINGTRGTMSNYTLDGGNAVDGFTQTPAPTPNPEAVAEFSMVSFALSAEYGRGAGAQVNVVTKSGTNKFHGALFEFLRNDKVNARTFFASTKPSLRQNQFGGMVSGPVVKNKTFFLFSYQKTLDHGQSLVTTSSMWSDMERAGNFTQSTRSPKDPTTGTVFPNKTIPASRLDPISVKFISQYLPSLSGGTSSAYRWLFNSKNDPYQYLARIDHSFGDKNRITGRYFANHSESNLNGGLPTFVNYSNWDDSNIVLEDTHIVSPSMTNVFRFTRNHVENADGPYGDLSFDQLGVKVNIPEWNGKKWFVLRTSDFTVQGRRVSDEARRVTEFSDTMSWIKGRHQIKFGADIRRVWMDLFLGSTAGGFFTFGRNFSGDSVADFLLGLPTTYAQSGYNYQKGTGWEEDFFFQDDIKVSRRLTLNVGLRWEPRVPPVPDGGVLTTYLAGQQSTRFVNAPRGLVFPGDAGVPEGGYFRDLNNWAPRFGFAWDVFGDGKTSVRGGYGIFYDNIRWACFQQQASGEPFTPNVTINAPGSFADPYGATGTPNPFPFDPLSVSSNSAFSSRVAVTTFDPNFRIGYIQYRTLAVERQLPWDNMLRVAYVGNKGTSLWSSRELNYGRFIPGASTLSNIDSRRPIAGMGSVDISESHGVSHYDSLQVTLTRRYSHGFTLLTSYTWAKSLDNISQGRNSLSQPWPDNIWLNYGRSDFNRDHTLTASFVWDIPFLRKRTSLLGKTLGGWQWNGIVNKTSGGMLTVVPGVATSMSGTGGERADLNGDPGISGDRTRDEKMAKWFNTAVFSRPADGSWGNGGRNIMEGPGSWNCDFAFLKRFHINDQHFVEFRSEFFNALNHANLGSPNVTLTSTSFGKITATGDARVIQFALKYSF